MTTDANEPGTNTPAAGETTQTTAADQSTVVTSTEVKEGATDAKPDTKVEEGKGDGAKADEPVVYDFKLPEGVELDAGAADKFKAIATELKLPADGAQKVVDLYAKLQADQTQAFADQVKAWGEQVNADKELGDTENQAAARKAVDTFGTPELKSLLNSTGMGNHPEVVRLMVKIGKAISEDTITRGKQGEKPKDAANVLYGSNT